jgi:RNA polymerase sigma-70 factor (ECF subfamily)
MTDEHVSTVVQRYLDELAVGAEATPLIRGLLDSAVERLRLLCAIQLTRHYPRLARPPLNLDADEMLSAVVERLIKALQGIRPTHVRQFFALANKHIRWELNDLVRRLDEQAPDAPLEAEAAAPDPSGSQLNPTARRILEAIERLPDQQREIFELIRIQGLTYSEAADVAGVSIKTVQRRLHSGLILLSDELCDLGPVPLAPNSP